MDAGAHASTSDRRQVQAGPGDLVFVNPGEVHDGRPIGGHSRSWRILYFEPVLVAELRSDIAECDTPPLFFPDPAFTDAQLRGMFVAAFGAATCLPGPFAALACETLLLRLVDRLSARAGQRIRSPGNQVASLTRVRELIESDPGSPELTLRRLAEEVQLSRFQLVRAFARSFCLTPHAYVLQRRLGLARRLIRSGIPLADVAVRTGFCDQSHLSRCFVRQFGVTPAHYAAVGT
jgi:AraC-like DNA-binding protein